VTKPMELCKQDIDEKSAWQTGLPWMTLPTDQLPKEQLTRPPKDDEIDVFEQETFPEVFLLDEREERELLLSTDSCRTSACNQAFVVATHPLKEEWLSSHVDFESLGWKRALKKVSLICRFVEKLRHAVHVRKKENRDGCCFCTLDPSGGLERLALRQILRAASRQAEIVTTRKNLDRDYTFENGLWFCSSRLAKEGPVDSVDVDGAPFFDAISFRKVVPIVLVQSPIFAAYVAYVHDRLLDHPGVEPTLREIKLTMMPMGGPSARAFITAYKKKCTKCRIRLKETIQKELADFPNCRTTIAPPFYFVQADIAMAFRSKPYNNSRRATSTAHALVLVCLTTSATNILVMDGLSTQSVVMALERHASRYGMPGEIFVDPGTQLVKLRDTSFDLRGVDGAVFRGSTFRISVSTPKAHEQHGRVERKIRILRDMLQRLSDTTELCDTLLGWETVFARIASQVDDLPIARGSSSAPTDIGWEIITPNRLKLGRNNHRNLDGEVILDGAPRTLLDRNKAIFKSWYGIFMDRLHLLVPTVDKTTYRDLQLNDIVLFKFQDANVPQLEVWKLGRVIQLISARTVLLQYSHAGAGHKQIRRSVRQISLILGVEEYMKQPLQEASEPT